MEHSVQVIHFVYFPCLSYSPGWLYFAILLTYSLAQYGQSQYEKSKYPRGPESASIEILPFRPKFT